MSEQIDWSLTTFAGLRKRQHQEFIKLSFREKLARVEAMNDIVRRFQTFALTKSGGANHQGRQPQKMD